MINRKVHGRKQLRHTLRHYPGAVNWLAWQGINFFLYVIMFQNPVSYDNIDGVNILKVWIQDSLDPRKQNFTCFSILLLIQFLLLIWLFSPKCNTGNFSHFSICVEYSEAVCLNCKLSIVDNFIFSCKYLIF